MNVEFENINDTHRKLDGCIVEYKGAIHSVRVDPGNTDHYKVTLRKVPNGRAFTVNTKEEEFEARFLPLGYMNYEKGCVWLSRSPARRMTLGIGDRVVEFSDVDGKTVLRNVSIASQDYVNLYENKYPTYAEAIKKLTSTPISSIALSRDFAMGWLDRPYMLRLYYKATPVGMAKMDGEVPILQLYKSPFKSFLAPLIRELQITHE